MLEINNLDIAKQLMQMNGEFCLVEMDRLKSILTIANLDQEQQTSFLTEVNQAVARYQLTGIACKRYEEEMLPMLQLNVNVALPILCQRCLSFMSLDLNLSFVYAICDEPPEALLEDDEVEWLEVDANMNLMTLVEDELIMALPIAAIHNDPCIAVKTEVGQLSNPFEVLKGQFP